MATEDASKGVVAPTFAVGSANARSLEAYTLAGFGEMDRQLHGAPPPADRALWNISGVPRVRRQVERIVGYARHERLAAVRVLNLSGLNEGKPDPVLFDLVAERLGGTKLSWGVVDHPLSETFGNPIIRGWLAARGMDCIAQDFRELSFDVPDAQADIVLCTEIIEHLDYSVAIRLLRCCRRALRPGGLLIVSTPNALFLRNRIMVLLGAWDFLHHMDTPEDADRGMLGHIMYYDGARLTRLLGGLGFSAMTAETFNAGHGPGEYRTIFTRAAAIALRAASRLVPRSGQVLMVTATRAN
jgi:SAM-dependent methyltransferase